MFAGFDFDVLIKSLPFLWLGMQLTLQLTVLAVGGGLILGTVLAVIRLSPIKPLSMAVAAYVNFLRSMPLILVIFWFYTLIPRVTGTSVSSFYSVLIAFIMFEAAYYSEIIRAGISSVRRGQISAALALGLTPPQAMRYVVLPQAVRNMIPVLLTQSIIMLQDTSLVYVVGLRDFLTSAEIVAGRDNRPIELYLTVALVFLVVCFSASRLVNLMRRRYSL
ncbi:MAG: amino acid ABC transporter permease [Alphaproteobacteria bacterium]|nr:amino acid ABC transporter permease [Alphaproteobacteria bacterium]